MKWLTQFMYGRYGNDQLNLFLLILCIIFSLLRFVFNRFWILCDLALILYFYRMLSKQTYKRYNENTKFMNMIAPIQKWYKRTKNKWKYRKEYKYFKCPSCHQYLRVPRGKGKIEITCPHCHNHFDKKT